MSGSLNQRLQDFAPCLLRCVLFFFFFRALGYFTVQWNVGWQMLTLLTFTPLGDALSSDRYGQHWPPGASEWELIRMTYKHWRKCDVHSLTLSIPLTLSVLASHIMSPNCVKNKTKQKNLKEIQKIISQHWQKRKWTDKTFTKSTENKKRCESVGTLQCSYDPDWHICEATNLCQSVILPSWYIIKT